MKRAEREEGKTWRVCWAHGHHAVAAVGEATRLVWAMGWRRRQLKYRQLTG